MTEPLGQLLEFRLGDERYCIDIAYIDEIVDTDEVRSLPNAPAHVVGVTDLRGRTTTVIDPSVVLDVERASDRSHIVVLDTDALAESDGAVGWLVEDVQQVITASSDDLEQTATMDDTVAGVITSGTELIVQLDPSAIAT